MLCAPLSQGNDARFAARASDVRLQLFDVTADPGETTDLLPPPTTAAREKVAAALLDLGVAAACKHSPFHRFSLSI